MGSNLFSLEIDGLGISGLRPAPWTLAEGGLDGWTDGPAVDTGGRQPRPQQHGMFGARAWRRGRQVIVTARAFAPTSEAAGQRRREATALLADGHEGRLEVTEPDGSVTSAMVRLDAPPLVRWTPQVHMVRAQWTFFATDPLRYGTEVTDETGFVLDRSGLEFDLFTDGDGIDTGLLEFSQPESEDTGVVTLANEGTAETWPSFAVSGPVSDEGFQLVAAGRIVRYGRGVPAGSVLVLDSATGRATLDGADTSAYLTLREWTPVPPGGQIDVAFQPLGGATAARLTVTTRSAWW